jgi:hypothetical protein
VLAGEQGALVFSFLLPNDERTLRLFRFRDGWTCAVRHLILAAVLLLGAFGGVDLIAGTFVSAAAQAGSSAASAAVAASS